MRMYDIRLFMLHDFYNLTNRLNGEPYALMKGYKSYLFVDVVLIKAVFPFQVIECQQYDIMSLLD